MSNADDKPVITAIDWTRITTDYGQAAARAEEQEDTMSSAVTRVQEYLRQRKRQNPDLGVIIHGVFTDPEAEMADLTIPDLEEVLRLALMALREDQKKDQS